MHIHMSLYMYIYIHILIYTLSLNQNITEYNTFFLPPASTLHRQFLSHGAFASSRFRLLTLMILPLFLGRLGFVAYIQLMR